MNIFNISIDHISDYRSFFDVITHTDRPLVIFTPNPEMLLRAQRQSSFAETLWRADYRVPDGTGLYIAAELLRISPHPLVRLLVFPWVIVRFLFDRKSLYARHGVRICGSDLTRDLIEYAGAHGLGVSILDLPPDGDQRKADCQATLVQTIESRYPGVRVHLHLDEPGRRQEIIDAINTTDDVFLFSTVGMVRQEESILDIMPHTPHIRIGMGVGSSIDYITGFQRPIPSWIRRAGIEWVYRLYAGTRRLNRLKRLYDAVIVFLVRVIRS